MDYTKTTANFELTCTYMYFNAISLSRMERYVLFIHFNIKDWLSFSYALYVQPKNRIEYHAKYQTGIKIHYRCQAKDIVAATLFTKVFKRTGQLSAVTDNT